MKIEHERLNTILGRAKEIADIKFPHERDSMRMHMLVHASIAIAGEHGRERSRVARAMGISPHTLVTRLSGSEKCLTLSNIAQLIFDASVLGADAHGWLIAQLALQADRAVLMHASDRVSDGDLNGETLDVSDALGHLANRVRSATEHESPGGRRVTEEERRGIGAAACGVIEEAAQLCGGGS